MNLFNAVTTDINIFEKIKEGVTSIFQNFLSELELIFSNPESVEIYIWIIVSMFVLGIVLSFWGSILAVNKKFSVFGFFLTILGIVLSLIIPGLIFSLFGSFFGVIIYNEEYKNKKKQSKKKRKK